jgi:hypothetical protein
MTLASAVVPVLKQQGYEVPLWVTVVFSYILQLAPLGYAMKATVDYIKANKLEIDRLVSASLEAEAATNEGAGAADEKRPLQPRPRPADSALYMPNGGGDAI